MLPPSVDVFRDDAAAAKSLRSCPTLCDPIDGSPPGSPIPGILQARTLERVAISFSNAWKWKVKVKWLCHVRPSATPWTAAHQASLSITNFRSPPKPMSIESVTPSNHLILCCPLLLLSSIVPSIRVFSNESALRIRWPKCWSFRTGWISLQSKLKGAFTDAGRFAFTSSCVAVSVHEEEVLKK